MNELQKPFIKENESPKLEKAFIKLSESEKRTEIARRKDPEEKKYIILIRSDYDGDDIDHTWIEVIGRTEAYEKAKALAESNIVNIAGPDASFVLVEGNNLENSVSLYWFLKGMQNIFKDGFNVDDYAGETSVPDNKEFNPATEAGTSQVDVTYNPDNESGIDI